MAGFGELIGGAMQGAGRVMERQGEAMRAAAIKKLEMEQEQSLREHGLGVASGYRQTELKQNHDFNMDERKFTAGRDDDRATRSDEAALDRIDRQAGATRGNEKYRDDLGNDDVDRTVTLKDGSVVQILKNGKSRTVTNEKGQPVRGTQPDKDKGDESDRIARIEARFTDTDGVVNREGIAGYWRDRQREDIAGDYADKPAKPAKVPTPKLPDGLDTSKALAEARSAIARGKDPEGVKAKLRKYGIDPRGL